LRVVLPSDDVLTVARGEEFGRARWSPDGSRIAYSEQDALYVFDVATGDVERVANGEYGDWLDDGRLFVVG
jgi:Tol biopolymer transport system component